MRVCFSTSGEQWLHVAMKFYKKKLELNAQLNNHLTFKKSNKLNSS